MTPQDADLLVAAFRRRFDAAEVQAELISSSGRYRFNVIAPEFATMTQLQRQDAVWKVVDDELSRDASLDVSLILAYSPAELAGTGS